MTGSTSPRPSSPPREALAGLIAFAVALGCVLPPILHFVTGPLGPLIGGVVASKLVARTARARAIVALTMGAAMTGALTGVLSVVRHFGKAPAEWFSDQSVIALGIAGAALYAAGMCACGVVIGHFLADKKDTPPQPAPPA